MSSQYSFISMFNAAKRSDTHWVFCCSQLAGMCWVDLTVAATWVPT